MHILLIISLWQGESQKQLVLSTTVHNTCQLPSSHQVEIIHLWGYIHLILNMLYWCISIQCAMVSCESVMNPWWGDRGLCKWTWIMHAPALGCWQLDFEKPFVKASQLDALKQTVRCCVVWGECSMVIQGTRVLRRGIQYTVNHKRWCQKA